MWGTYARCVSRGYPGVASIRTRSFKLITTNKTNKGNNMTEQWKQIKGHKNNYECSDMGRVRNKHTMHVLRAHVNRYGYLQIKVAGCTVEVQRIIGDTWLEPDDTRPQFNHINMVKIDNRACNIERVTAQENSDLAHSDLWLIERYGRVFYEYNLSKYCRDNSINMKSLRDVASGKAKSNKGHTKVINITKKQGSTT